MTTVILLVVYIMLSWDVMPSSLVHKYQHLEESAAVVFMLKMEAASFSKMFVPLYPKDLVIALLKVFNFC
jgi:hypothetical protein